MIARLLCFEWHFCATTSRQQLLHMARATLNFFYQVRHDKRLSLLALFDWSFTRFNAFVTAGAKDTRPLLWGVIFLCAHNDERPFPNGRPSLLLLYLLSYSCQCYLFDTHWLSITVCLSSGSGCGSCTYISLPVALAPLFCVVGGLRGQDDCHGSSSHVSWRKFGWLARLQRFVDQKSDDRWASPRYSLFPVLLTIALLNFTATTKDECWVFLRNCHCDCTLALQERV